MTDSPLSILVVGDDDSLAELLRQAGHLVTIARTGMAALELAADDPPDVALLDVRLPGLSGWELARWLRHMAEGHQKRPFLIACGASEDRAKSLAVGCHLHLSKPVNPTVLTGVLTRFQRLLEGVPA